MGKKNEYNLEWLGGQINNACWILIVTFFITLWVYLWNGSVCSYEASIGGASLIPKQSNIYDSYNISLQNSTIMVHGEMYCRDFELLVLGSALRR